MTSTTTFVRRLIVGFLALGVQLSTQLKLERVLIVQVDSRGLEGDEMNRASYATLTSVLNHHYCKHHGYDYLLIQPTIDVKRFKANSTSTKSSAEARGGDARQVPGALHVGLGQLRSVSWAKLPALLYLSLQIGQYYDLIWYMDSDLAVSDKPSGRSIRDKLEVIQNASKCLGPARSTPCINWGQPKLFESPMLLFPNSPFGDTEPCAGTFMFRPTLAASLLLEWWNVDMPDKNFGLMHEQDALWNLTSSADGRFRRIVTLLQEFQFPPKNDKREMCVDGKQWLCHLITTDHEVRGPWFREMLEKAGFTQAHFRVAVHHIRKTLAMRLDMLDAGHFIDRHSPTLRANALGVNDCGSDCKVLFPKGLSFIPIERRLWRDRD